MSNSSTCASATDDPQLRLRVGVVERIGSLAVVPLGRRVQQRVASFASTNSIGVT
jgi:hypothetical protein